MAASRPEPAAAGGRPAPRLAPLFAAALLALPCTLGAQVEASPVLRGRVLLGDGVLSSGTVVLHRISEAAQGELDSASVAADGTFAFPLPAVPDPGRSEMYFASIRHAGVLYFGTPLTIPVQLDSTYLIQAYDTVMAPQEGATLPIQTRNLFLEEAGGGWQVTDVFQIRNSGDRTLVGGEGRAVWRYPLAAGATDPSASQTEFVGSLVEFEDGHLALRSPVAPGERIVVVRYTVPGPLVAVPMPGSTETMEVLVREPAPPLDVPGLAPVGRVEVEPGTTYRRFAGTGFVDHALEMVAADPPTRIRAEWMAVLLALALGAAGVWAVQARAAPRPAGSDAEDRQALLLEVAKLDEAFAALGSPSPEERGAYEARRRDLLRRLRRPG